jgi:hypothetical protein
MGTRGQIHVSRGAQELGNPRHALKRGDAGAWEVFLTECGSSGALHRARTGAAQKILRVWVEEARTRRWRNSPPAQTGAFAHFDLILSPVLHRTLAAKLCITPRPASAGGVRCPVRLPEALLASRPELADGRINSPWPPVRWAARCTRKDARQQAA